jgi:hypothetical protein
VSISTPLISPRSKPPAQITYFPESSSKVTKINHHSFLTRIAYIRHCGSCMPTTLLIDFTSARRTRISSLVYLQQWASSHS